jgi:cell division GTPase FtsZ
MPAKKQLFNAPVILSFGSGAGKVLSNLHVPDTYKIAVNSSERDLLLIDKKIDTAIVCGKGNGSGMNPTQGKIDVTGKMKALFKEIDTITSDIKIDKIDLIPCVFSLGHGFGTGSIDTVLEGLKTKYSDALIIPFVITPFSWEGKSVIDRAYNALYQATKLSTCFVISNEEVGQSYKDIGASYDKVNALIGDGLATMIKSFSATDGIIQSVDKNDFSKFMTGDLATIRHMRIKSAQDLKFGDIKEGIGKRWLKVEQKVFKPAVKLNIFYILDGKGPFSPQILGDITDYLSKKDYINMEYIKPLLIQRKSAGCDFVWMESGFKLKLDKNIYGEY